MEPWNGESFASLASTEVPTPQETKASRSDGWSPAYSCMLSGGWYSSEQPSKLLTFGKWEPFQALGTVVDMA